MVRIFGQRRSGIKGAKKNVECWRRMRFILTMMLWVMGDDGREDDNDDENDKNDKGDGDDRDGKENMLENINRMQGGGLRKRDC